MGKGYMGGGERRAEERKQKGERDRKMERVEERKGGRERETGGKTPRDPVLKDCSPAHGITGRWQSFRKSVLVRRVVPL